MQHYKNVKKLSMTIVLSWVSRVTKNKHTHTHTHKRCRLYKLQNTFLLQQLHITYKLLYTSLIVIIKTDVVWMLTEFYLIRALNTKAFSETEVATDYYRIVTYFRVKMSKKKC